MEVFKHFPLFTIIICFIGVVLCSLFKRKAARVTAFVVEILACILGCCVLIYSLINGTTIYQMGHLTEKENDPTIYYWFNNVIRFGILEGLLATIFPLILFFSILGGLKKIEEDIKPEKEKYFYVLSNLVLVSLISMIYTDDIFTGYVFLEISTLSSIGLIMIKQYGRTTVAAIRYMIFNLVGSGLYLIGCVLLYDLTGYFMFEKIQETLTTLVNNGQCLPAIRTTFALLTIGLGIKSGLFPFYYWMPDAYGESTTASSSIVSGLISKGYIILLIKFVLRGFGLETQILGETMGVINQTHLLDLIFILGACGMVFGSVRALFQKRINRMIAYSSAAQIGYVFLAIGLGSKEGMIAAVFQILAHSITKPLLFTCSSGLIDASDGKRQFRNIRGSGKRNIIAGIGFTIGSLSMIGFPLFAGFIVKYLYIDSAIKTVETYKIVITIIALVLSTLLNTAYLIRTVLTLYNNQYENITYSTKKIKTRFSYKLAIIGFSILNILIGLNPIFVQLITEGLNNFGYLA